ncbi:MAG: metallophosphoesterase, partial [Myxococcota bacterium]
ERGFRAVHTLVGDAIDAAEIARDPMSSDRRGATGPFDLVGDVHGCDEELRELLVALGWQLVAGERPSAVHPEGRTLVFVGDLTDRGPDSPAVLERVMNLVEDGRAHVVVGNHDYKLGRALRGEKVKPSHGLDRTLAQLESRDAAFRERVAGFVDQLPSHAVFDGGALVVAHAGLPEGMHGRSSGPVRSFAMYGETNGETDAYGLPVRLDWARNYRGHALVVHGHVPVVVPEWNHGTLDIDTGCCFGGALTALRYPERELVSVDALREHYPPTRPMSQPESPREPGALYVDDLVGRRPIATALGPRVVVSEASGAWALEQLSRFAVDPGWLVTTPIEDARAETPEAAMAAYPDPGELAWAPLSPGERVVVAVCRDAEVARARFGVSGPARAAAWDARGRTALSEAELAELADAVARAAPWDALGTPWVVLDAVVAPRVTAPGPEAVAALALARALEQLGCAPERALRSAQDEVARTRPAPPPAAPVSVLHLLASEGAVHTEKPLRWHREQLGALDPRPLTFASAAGVRAVASP